MKPRGTQGYAEWAETLALQYEAIAFDALHSDLRLPRVPARVLDIGSGSGRDAAHLAVCGFDVTAVEPVAEMRAIARRLHPEPIAWIADDLPLLGNVTGKFDLILATAVWMHLDEQERTTAMMRIADLLTSGGQVAISLRHGPVPKGRVMHDVDAPETIGLARSAGLSLTNQVENASVQGTNRTVGVRWTRLTFCQASGVSQSG